MEGVRAWSARALRSTTVAKSARLCGCVRLYFKHSKLVRPQGGSVDMRSCRDFSSFALGPRGAARFSSFAPPAEPRPLFAERPV